MNASGDESWRGAPARDPDLGQRGRVIVVTGLPRSGTSMVMQMLEAGGIPLLTDGERQPDESNPRGYHELEAAKRVEHDADFLFHAHGKAVKVVVPLVKRVATLELPALVLLVERDLDTVLASQRRMAEAAGATVTDAEQSRLRIIYREAVADAVRMIRENPQQNLLQLRYEDILANPIAAAKRISRQLPVCVDTTAMAAMVDPCLNHSR